MADRLNIKEKYKVQQLLNKDVTLEVIAEDIGKSESCINKYIADELIPLLNKIDYAKTQTENKDFVVFITQEVKDEAVGMLVAADIPEGVAKEFIAKQIEPGLAEPITEATRLYKLCINNLAVHTSMVKKTAGGKSGVTISNQAVSQIAEEAKTKVPLVATRPNHIFRPKG